MKTLQEGSELLLIKQVDAVTVKCTITTITETAPEPVKIDDAKETAIPPDSEQCVEDDNKDVEWKADESITTIFLKVPASASISATADVISEESETFETATVANMPVGGESIDTAEFATTAEIPTSSAENANIAKTAEDSPAAEIAETTSLMRTVTVIYSAELSLADLPEDGSELRSTLQLQSAEEGKPALTVSFKAAYESIEALISSKRLEFVQLEGEIKVLSQAINDLKSPEKKEKATASAAKDTKKKKVTKKAPPKRSTSAGGRSSVSTGKEEDESAPTSSKRWLPLSAQEIQEYAINVTSSVASLAVEHRAVPLFVISAIAIYFAGDYASV